MDDLTRIRTFIKVVELGSFSAVARDQSSVSAVARQVKSLEDELGARLLNRSTRSLSLTDTGRRFYERVIAITQALDNAKSEAISEHEEVKGPLRVSLRISAGTTVVIPALPKFLAKYPDLELDVSLTDERKDLIANNIDVALWLGALPDAEIVARRLSTTRRILYGAPAYFEKHGVPKEPQDLRSHDCLLFTASNYGDQWGFCRDGQVEEVKLRGSIKSDNGLVLLSAALAGLGISIAHEWMLHNHLTEGRLVQVMSDYTVNPRPGDADLYAVFPSSRGLSRKVRAFVDFLIECFGDAKKD